MGVEINRQKQIEVGDVIVISSDEEVHIAGGMLVSFPKGMKCTWEIRETIKKVYIFNLEIAN